MLTSQQEAFCRAYVLTANASEAYRQAYGGIGKTSTVRGVTYRLLKSKDSAITPAGSLAQQCFEVAV